MAKKSLTPEQVYKRNQKWAKALEIIAPFVFWGFLTLAVICLIFAVKNSFGNIAEIMRLLDSEKYTGEQLAENYNLLVGKWGEWIIGNGGTGFQIKFINIGNAVFSGLMIFNLTMSIVLFIGAFVVGKWLLPMLSKSITQSNQDMVNLTVLKGK
jgi:hypothetical protein